MRIKRISVLGGRNRSGGREPVARVSFEMGAMVSIVGPTGSGKTTLINDIELFANRNTPTGRQVKINGRLFPGASGPRPRRNPVAMISQHTNFLSDLPVDEFLRIHAQVRGSDPGRALEATLRFANLLTGEPIIRKNRMTELSGGQTRALLIADAVVIGASPIILLDEIENAGIHRIKVLELLKSHKKVFIFVTHDPRIALISDFRIVMKNGAMLKVIKTSAEEKLLSEEIKAMDDLLLDLRARIRAGRRLQRTDMAGWRRAAASERLR
jgi:ABC-type lipoprotein export system ATPase subunit